MAAGLGSRVAQLRAVSGLSARELDKLAGLTPGHTRFIELGQKRPDLVAAETVKQLARVLGASIDWLFSGDGRAPSAHLVRAAVGRAKEDVAKPTGTED